MLTRSDIAYIYKFERSGRCSHTNENDVWGIGFDTSKGRIFVYSMPSGGVYCQDHNGDVTQLAGACQFSGSDSKAVKRWLDNAVEDCDE